MLEELPRDEESDLELLLGVTGLLASCAEGKLDHVETVCEGILSLEEILDVLRADISLNRKLPFLRFLTSVYLDTDSSILPDNDSELVKGE